MMISHHIGHQGAVHHQFPHPKAVLALLAQEIILRTRNGRFQLGKTAGFRVGRPPSEVHLTVVTIM